MITGEEATRLLTGEVEECVALLGGRLVGGGLRVSGIRMALGQTGAVAPHESFLLSRAAEGRRGWAVEVRLEVPDGTSPPATVEQRRDSTLAPRTPMTVLEARPCTVLRGTSRETATALAALGIESVGTLARLPESRLDQLVGSRRGISMLDPWSRAQLLTLPLPDVAMTAGLRSMRLADLVGSSPARLRDAGIDEAVSDGRLEELSRSLALLGAALDVAVLRQITLGDVTPRQG